jgi:lysophospholipase L1-like esterase
MAGRGIEGGAATMRARLLVRRVVLVGCALALAGGALAPPVAASTASGGHHHSASLAALGDSYSSGEGNPPYLAADGCDRSAQAWPLLAAAKLHWAVTNLACSGAQTTHVVSTPFKGQLPQVAALAALRPRPDVVTITIGGNDIGFSNVGACFSPAIPDCTGIIAAADLTILTVLPGRLAETYRAVEAAAPWAKLVVVGYPRLVPSHQSDVTECGSVLTDPERRALNHAVDLLNGVIAVQARRAGARYVDVSRTLKGHELCTSDSWLVPLTAQGAAHPNAEGQRAIARRVAHALKGALHSVGSSRLHS